VSYLPVTLFKSLGHILTLKKSGRIHRETACITAVPYAYGTWYDETFSWIIEFTRLTINTCELIQLSERFSVGESHVICLYFVSAHYSLFPCTANSVTSVVCTYHFPCLIYPYTDEHRPKWHSTYIMKKRNFRRNANRTAHNLHLLSCFRLVNSKHTAVGELPCSCKDWS
jgi:hypothetical protein